MTTMRSIYHPICHLIQGHRLYYILLSLTGDHKNSEKRIDAIIENAELEKSTCAYYVFGEADLIFRIWATESEINFLQSHIEKTDGILIKDMYLISRTSTWYQREIESVRGWSRELSTPKQSEHKKAVQNIMQGEPSESLRLEYNAGTSSYEKVKVFMFLDQKSKTGQKAFDFVKSAIEEREGFWCDQDTRVSYYSYYSIIYPGKTGVLLKADITKFSENSTDLVKLSVELSSGGYLDTTTYIGCKPITIESETLRKVNVVDKHYRKKVIHNLLLSHDTSEYCHTSKNDQVSLTEAESVREQKERCDAFVELFRDGIFYQLFNYDEVQWNPTISRLRIFYKLVREKNQDLLKSWIINDLIKAERNLRKQTHRVIDHMLQLQEIDNDFYSQLNGERASLKDMLIHLPRCLISSLDSVNNSDVLVNDLPTVTPEPIKRYINKVKEPLIKERNWLLHGYIDRVFLPTEQFIENLPEEQTKDMKNVQNHLHEYEYVWEFLIHDYAQFRLSYPWLVRGVDQIIQFQTIRM